ncbi:hypothetical protein GJ744_010593 [Endocarpon pusillum]|uniref:Uncharacterized protein n=1 Tax=Endocarpon pusillum TaxID=364733 RepID=A0A8H7ARZ0_9EURO|nr:hypothetical protein GJ744_010593 [Endocarpon pusillum]
MISIYKPCSFLTFVLFFPSIHHIVSAITVPFDPTPSLPLANLSPVLISTEDSDMKLSALLFLGLAASTVSAAPTTQDSGIMPNTPITE